MKDIENNADTNEETPLLQVLHASPAGSESTGTQSVESFVGSMENVNSETSIEKLLEKETEEPWPASFERSVSLLASPYPRDARDIDRMTRSPLRSVTPLMVTRNQTRNRAKESFDHGFQRLVKRHSLEGMQDGISLVDDRNELLRKKVDMVEDAKAYRQKILQQQQDTGIVTKVQVKGQEDKAALYSPGRMKEIRTDRLSKRKKDEAAKKGAGDESSFSQCLFNLANILMGVGMLGLPYVYKAAGWLGGTLVLLFFGFVTWRTSILIGRLLNGDPRPGHIFEDSPFKTPLPPGSGHKMARVRKPIKSFPQIAREAFGNTGAIFLSVVLYFELFSCLAIFLVSLGEHMHSLIPMVSTSTHEVMMAFALAIPTAVLRTPALLSYLSAVGTFATSAVVLSVVLVAIIQGDVSDEVAQSEHGVVEPPYHIAWRITGLPLALGLVAFCFSGHAVVPSIYLSMKKPQEFEQMATTTYVVVMACCLLVAFCGYYTFGSTVQDQVTISLADEPSGNGEKAIMMLTGLMVLTAFSKFTLTMFPLSLGMEELAAPSISSDLGKELASYLIRLVLILLALLVAIYVPSFSLLCSLVGLICTMIVSVICPAAAHLKLFAAHLSPAQKLLDCVFIAFGTFAAVVGTYATLSN